VDWQEQAGRQGTELGFDSLTHATFELHPSDLESVFMRERNHISLSHFLRRPVIVSDDEIEIAVNANLLLRNLSLQLQLTYICERVSSKIDQEETRIADCQMAR
jgi:hypothetical protein